MSDRLSEARWQWRFLVLDILLAIGLEVGVGKEMWVDFAAKAKELRERVER